MRALTRAEVRDVDRRAIEEFCLPGLVLMENAGRGAAELLLAQGVKGPVVIACGKGNNAGDGFVIARHLDNHGIPVRVLLAADSASLTGDAATNFQVILRSGVLIQLVERTEDWPRLLHLSVWVVDALLGTGAQGTIREPFVAAIEAINQSGRKVLAVDLPSGMDCDTGQPLGCCVRADVTATFVSRKVGFDQPGAAAWTGDVHVIDIGCPRAILDALH